MSRDVGDFIVATSAAICVVATYLWFVNVELVSPPVRDSEPPTAMPTQLNTKIQKPLLEQAPLQSEVKSILEPKPPLRVQAQPERRENLPFNPEREQVLREENGFAQEMPFDTTAPSPTADNMTAEPTGEFADQIDQQSIFEQAVADGLLEVTSDWDEQEPSDENISFMPEDELTQEIDEHEILSMAGLDDYELPEVDPDSHPPTEMNELYLPDDGYADEIVPEM